MKCESCLAIDQFPERKWVFQSIPLLIIRQNFIGDGIFEFKPF